MKKIIFLVVFLSLHCVFAQKREVSLPAKMPNVIYPSYTEEKELIERLQSDIRLRTPGIVQGGWDTYFAFGALKQGVTKDQYESMLLANDLRVVEIDGGEIDNSGWSVSKQSYVPCTVTVSKMKCLANSQGRVLIKLTSNQKSKHIQPCLNILYPKTSNNIEPEEFVTVAELPMDLPQTNFTQQTVSMVQQPQAQILLQFPQHYPTPSAVVTVNTVPQMALPIVINNNTTVRGNTRPTPTNSGTNPTQCPGGYWYTYPDGERQWLCPTTGIGTDPGTGNGSTGIGTNPGTGNGSTGIGVDPGTGDSSGSDTTPPNNPGNGSGADPGRRRI